MSAIPRYAGKDRRALQHILRDFGFRSTEGRLTLLAALKRSQKPLPVHVLAQQIEAHLDAANVYRALEAFTRAGIASRVDLQHGHAHYELKDQRHDHHHIVCTGCNKIEDFIGCDYGSLSDRALKQANGFAKILDHSFELFGLCKDCVNA